MNSKTAGPQVSIVVPTFNEAGTLATLVKKIDHALVDAVNGGYEIIFVDDGSTDESWAEMAAIARSNPRARALRLRRNFGKAAALSVGIDAARGSVIVTMDADLQDDPIDIPRFLEKIADGFDVVSGWKESRKDPLTKTIPSRLFNFITAKASGIRLHDFNCGFKAYRAEVFDHFSLYGELHRYVPVLAHGFGFKVGEMTVIHHSRTHGRSKYGLERFLRGAVDLLTIVAITQYSSRPGHLFGGIGAVLGTVGFLILSYLSILWFVGGGPIGTRPLLTFGVLLMIVSLQFLFFGMLAEMILFRSRRLPPHRLTKESIWLDQADDEEPS
ncbi:MAG: glycosyltransferase family 2 protein [Rhodospirillales bacterium]|nr:glycosyltransferase family 2 protein [Rhodospirillales bacterium]